MKLTIVYDNEVLREDLDSGWGFSCHIELKENNLLFDTGWDGNILVSNMKRLGVNPKDVDNVVLSHSHWDHIGGLTNLLLVNQKLMVYVPRSFGKQLKREIATRSELVEISKPQEVTEECISTGELGTSVPEQSVMIKTSKGLLVVTGCAHPTLKNILRIAQDFGKVYAVIGGFHGFNEYDLLREISLIIPCHCTAHKREIQKLFPNAYSKGGVGCVVEIK